MAFGTAANRVEKRWARNIVTEVTSAVASAMEASVITRPVASDAPLGFGQAGDLARPLGGAGGEQLEDSLQREAGFLAEQPHLRSATGFQVVVADQMYNRPVLGGHVADPLGRGEELGHLVVPELRLLEESLLVHGE